MEDVLRNASRQVLRKIIAVGRIGVRLAAGNPHSTIVRTCARQVVLKAQNTSLLVKARPPGVALGGKGSTTKASEDVKPATRAENGPCLRYLLFARDTHYR